MTLLAPISGYRPLTSLQQLPAGNATSAATDTDDDQTTTKRKRKYRLSDMPTDKVDGQNPDGSEHYKLPTDTQEREYIKKIFGLSEPEFVRQDLPHVLNKDGTWDWGDFRVANMMEVAHAAAECEDIKQDAQYAQQHPGSRHIVFMGRTDAGIPKSEQNGLILSVVIDLAPQDQDKDINEIFPLIRDALKRDEDAKQRFNAVVRHENGHRFILEDVQKRFDGLVKILEYNEVANLHISYNPETGKYQTTQVITQGIAKMEQNAGTMINATMQKINPWLNQAVQLFSEFDRTLKNKLHQSKKAAIDYCQQSIQKLGQINEHLKPLLAEKRQQILKIMYGAWEVEVAAMAPKMFGEHSQENSTLSPEDKYAYGTYAGMRAQLAGELKAPDEIQAAQQKIWNAMQMIRRGKYPRSPIFPDYANNSGLTAQAAA